MKSEIKTLDNKLNTLFLNSPGSTCATVQIWFRAGSALEEESDYGIAHFLEHMFFKGTPTRPGSKIAHEVESYGGEINAFTSFDYTCYYINTPNTHLEQTVSILMDMVSNPEFKNEELIPERDVVFEEYRRSLDNPNQFSFMQLQTTSFDNGYDHPILGNEVTIKSFSREQLLHFREKFYNTNNSMLVIAGDIQNQAKLEAIINQYKMPEGSPSHFPQFKMKKNQTLDIHKKDVRQSTLTIAIEGFDYDNPKVGPEDLAINCLAYGETSWLYKNLVSKKPLASAIGGSTMYFVNGGSHYIKMALPPENLKLATDEFLATIKKVIKVGFTDDEVNKIKNQYIASKIYERESIESYSFSLGHGFAQNGDIHCESTFIDKLKKANTKQVNEAIGQIFSRNIHISVQTPQNENSAKTKTIVQSFQKKLKALAPKKKSQSKLPFSVLTSKYDKATQVYNLKPGIKLIYRQNLMTPTFVLHAYIKGGLASETAKNAGTYNLIGKSFTYGYKGVKYDFLRNDLESKSSSLNGFSGKNAYGLTMHGLSEFFPDLAKHFMGTLIEPEFPTKYVSLEKQLLYRALENQKEDPVKQCFKAFNEIIFDGHPYALNLIGDNKSLKSISAQKLKLTHAKNIKGQEMVLTYCGDLDIEELLEYLAPYLKKLGARKGIKRKIPLVKPKSGQKIEIPFNREQTQILIARSGYNITKKEDLYLKMLTAHLAGQSSELFVEVRDRQGLCYAVQPLHHTALEAGYWGIYIAAGFDKTDAAIEAIMNILNRLQKDGFTQEEFERVKVMIDGQSLISIQTNDDYASIYSVPVLHNLGLDLEHQSNEEIRKIKYEDFQKFLSTFLKTKWNIIKVGRTS